MVGTRASAAAATGPATALTANTTAPAPAPAAPPAPAPPAPPVNPQLQGPPPPPAAPVPPATAWQLLRTSLAPVANTLSHAWSSLLDTATWPDVAGPLASFSAPSSASAAAALLDGFLNPLKPTAFLTITSAQQMVALVGFTAIPEFNDGNSGSYGALHGDIRRRASGEFRAYPSLVRYGSTTSRTATAAAFTSSNPVQAQPLPDIISAFQADTTIPLAPATADQGVPPVVIPPTLPLSAPLAAFFLRPQTVRDGVTLIHQLLQGVPSAEKPLFAPLEAFARAAATVHASSTGSALTSQWQTISDPPDQSPLDQRYAQMCATHFPTAVTPGPPAPGSHSVPLGMQANPPYAPGTVPLGMQANPSYAPGTLAPPPAQPTDRLSDALSTDDLRYLFVLTGEQDMVIDHPELLVPDSLPPFWRQFAPKRRSLPQAYSFVRSYFRNKMMGSGVTAPLQITEAFVRMLANLEFDGNDPTSAYSARYQGLTLFNCGFIETGISDRAADAALHDKIFVSTGADGILSLTTGSSLDPPLHTQ